MKQHKETPLQRAVTIFPESTPRTSNADRDQLRLQSALATARARTESGKMTANANCDSQWAAAQSELDPVTLLRRKKVLALITARGGSKGLRRKNLLPACGRPLMAWTISAAAEAEFVSRVVVSTDDDEIMEAARAWGGDVPFRRPSALASDTASSVDVVLHALDQLPSFDYVVLLQPTFPLRTAADIDAALKLAAVRGAPSCVSVCKASQSPYWMCQLDSEGRLAPVFKSPLGASRRPDLPSVYMPNGAIYVARVDWLRQTRTFLGAGSIAYPMPLERSLDIDTPEDFEQLNRTVSHRQQRS